MRPLPLLTLLAVAICSAPAAAQKDRRVAVTVDDLPVQSVFKDTATWRRVTLQILLAANDARMPLTGFVNEKKLERDGRLDPTRVDLLHLWLAAGADLGNHTYSHGGLHDVSVEAFEADVLRGEVITRALLEARGKMLRYFRHPFLHTGRTLEIRDAVHAFLDTHDYTVAPVTIDNSEWIFARAYDLALRDDDSELATRIGREYIDYMERMTAYYEDQSQQLFDREIAQVLLIHANTLNGDWLDELALMLQRRGYRFIDLDEALKDPAYESEDRYTGAGGITWLHRWALTRNADPEMFRGEPETPEFVVEASGLNE